jgi:hypothetical protein
MRRIYRTLINADGTLPARTFWGFVRMPDGVRLGFGRGFIEMGNACWGLYLSR